jgi:hypothetical protein
MTGPTQRGSHSTWSMHTGTCPRQEQGTDRVQAAADGLRVCVWGGGGWEGGKKYPPPATEATTTAARIHDRGTRPVKEQQQEQQPTLHAQCVHVRSNAMVQEQAMQSHQLPEQPLAHQLQVCAHRQWHPSGPKHTKGPGGCGSKAQRRGHLMQDYAHASRVMTHP